VRLVLTAAFFVFAALPAHAQSSSQNLSEASKQTSLAIGAIGESGLKASSGVVAIPLGAVAITSGAVGHSANASGYTDIGKAFSNGAEDATKGAKAFVDFSNSPLSVTEEVIVGRKTPPAAQPAPNVPFTTAQ
jgi:hypothetical protein